MKKTTTEKAYEIITNEECLDGKKHTVTFGGVIRCFCTRCLKRFDHLFPPEPMDDPNDKKIPTENDDAKHSL